MSANSSKAPLKIAILGFGGRAQGMAKIALELKDLMRITCVADPFPMCRNKAREMLGAECRLFESGEEFYAQDVPIDGIWVLSQERTHAQLAVPALERKIPLITEKPLATSISDAYRICEAFKKNPVPMTVPHSLRFLPAYRKVKEIVDSGVLGRILHIHAVEQVGGKHTAGYYRRGPGMYRHNTTFLLAKSSHDIDIINWMMGGVRAKSVACFGGSHFFVPNPDLPKVCSTACPQAQSCEYLTKSSPVSTEKVDRDTTAIVNASLCAFNSGAEQVDHQTIIIEYENGTTVDFTLKCFGDHQRPLQITGSHGTVYANFSEVKLIIHHPYKVVEFGADQLPGRAGSHGGADISLVEDWANAILSGTSTKSASVFESAEAVAVCVAAEVAMLQHRVVEMKSLRDSAPGPEIYIRPNDRPL